MAVLFLDFRNPTVRERSLQSSPAHMQSLQLNPRTGGPGQATSYPEPVWCACCKRGPEGFNRSAAHNTCQFHRICPSGLEHVRGSLNSTHPMSLLTACLTAQHVENTLTP
jgi:hypothetical protein